MEPSFFILLQKKMKNCSAMIFAAGLGTRLYPLTADKPKALVEINGKTLLEMVITKLIASGIGHIVINVHHYSEMIKEFINHHPFDARIDISDESEQLLDTAGGLKFAEKFFSENNTILLYNVDIISNINLEQFHLAHLQNGSIATLAMRHRTTYRYLLFDEDNLLCGWRNKKSNEEIITSPHNTYNELAFSGIQFVNKEILSLIPAGQKLSMTPLYLQLAAQHPIKAYIHDNDTWKDLGKYEDWKALNK